MPKEFDADITIEGALGFYCIRAGSSRGRAFMWRVQGNVGGEAVCDDSDQTHTIADDAVTLGLRVMVNGREYTI